MDAVIKITDADWVPSHAVLRPSPCGADAPSADWLHSLLAGSRHLGDPHATASDLFWSDMPASGIGSQPAARNGQCTCANESGSTSS